MGRRVIVLLSSASFAAESLAVALFVETRTAPGACVSQAFAFEGDLEHLENSAVPPHSSADPVKEIYFFTYEF